MTTDVHIAWAIWDWLKEHYPDGKMHSDNGFGGPSTWCCWAITEPNIPYFVNVEVLDDVLIRKCRKTIGIEYDKERWPGDGSPSRIARLKIIDPNFFDQMRDTIENFRATTHRVSQ